MALEYRKRHFPGLYCLKKKVPKIAIFWPKPWVNPFGKVSIFGLFELLVFIAKKAVFSFQNNAKEIFLVYIAYKGKLVKGHFWTKTMVYPFGKMSIFGLFELLVFEALKAFLALEYRKRHFPSLYCLIRKVGKMAIFGQKPWVNPFGKMSIFRFF